MITRLWLVWAAASVACTVISRLGAVTAARAGEAETPRGSPVRATASADAASTHRPTVLGVAGARFTVNGRPTFLYGLSYYGALGAPEDSVRRDLDDLQRAGFNWIRVWATWNAYGTNLAAITPDGAARAPFLARLQRLVWACDRRGIVVDVTLSRNAGGADQAGLSALAGHQQAVATLLASLHAARNWYLDLANERNIRDARFVSFAELAALRSVGRRLDPGRLVTASHGGDLTREELRDYLETAGVDFLAPHRPRHAGSARETAGRTREYQAWMNALGRRVPVHYQEPFRRGYGDWQPQAGDFVTDARGAVAGGAAGWCFHNGSQERAPEAEPRRSFDLRRRRLFAQLDPVELEAIAALPQVVRPVSAKP